MEKDASFQIDPFGQSATADHECGIAGESPLRPDLTPVGAPPPDVRHGLSAGEGPSDFWKPGTALLTRQRGRAQILPQSRNICTMSRRHVFEIEELTSSVVVSTCPAMQCVSDGMSRPLSASRSRTQGVVGHHREHAGVGITFIAPAGPAIERGFVGIILGGAAMGAKEHQPGEGVVNPIIRKAVSTVRVCSSRVNPVRVIRSLCLEAERALRSYCRRRTIDERVQRVGGQTRLCRRLEQGDDSSSP